MKYVPLEWRKLRKNAWFFIALLLVGALYGYAFHHRYSVVVAQQARLDSAAADSKKKYASYLTMIDSAVRLNKSFPTYTSDPRNPAQLTRGVPRYGFLHQTPLSVLAIGQSDLFVRDWALNVWNRDPRLVAADIKNPLQLMFGQLDPATVLILLLPLLVIGFSYNILSGEREDGTLKIVSVQAASLKSWMAAKLLLPAAILFAFFFLETIILFLIYSVPWWQQSLHVVAFGILLLLYIGFWAGLCLLVNLYKRSSATNAVWLLGAWLMFTFILPSLFNMLAYQSFGAPSRVSFITTYRTAYGDAERGDRQETLNKYFFDHPELSKPDTSNKKYAPNTFPKASAIFYEYVYQKAEPVYDAYRQKRSGANRFAAAASFLSPSTLLQNGFNTISNSSQEQFLAFQDSAIRFRTTYLRWVKAKLVQDQELTWNDVKTLPSFEMATAKLSAAVWWVCAGLLLQVLLVYSGIRMRLNKMSSLIT